MKPTDGFYDAYTIQTCKYLEIFLSKWTCFNVLLKRSGNMQWAFMNELLILSILDKI